MCVCALFFQKYSLLLRIRTYSAHARSTVFFFILLLLLLSLHSISNHCSFILIAYWYWNVHGNECIYVCKYVWLYDCIHKICCYASHLRICVLCFISFAIYMICDSIYMAGNGGCESIIILIIIIKWKKKMKSKNLPKQVEQHCPFRGDNGLLHGV